MDYQAISLRDSFDLKDRPFNTRMSSMNTGRFFLFAKPDPVDIRLVDCHRVFLKLVNPFNSFPKMATQCLTQKEYHEMYAAIRRPEFGSLFMDYVDELSDPKNRAETIEYINGLEGANEIQDDHCLLRPSPWICLETYRRDSYSCKVFINILLTEYLDPIALDCDGGLSLPFIASSARLEKAESRPCVSVDVCVGSGTEIQASKHGTNFLVNISDSIIGSLNKSRFKQAPISRDVKLRKEWKYKDGLLSEEDIIPLLVRRDQLTRSPPVSRPDPEVFKEADSQRTSKNEFVECNSTVQDEPLVNTCDFPSYKLTESHSNDISTHLDFDLGATLPCRSLPERLRVTINLPNVKSARDIDLHYSEKTIDVNTVSPEHHISIPIPYCVDWDSCIARFDKNKHSLTLEMKI